jgi:hypothetical protein
VTDLEQHLLAQLEQSKDFFWHRLRWRAVRGWLPKQGAFRLLDVGAGAGLLGEYVRDDFPAAEYMFDEPIESLRGVLTQRHGADRDWTGRSDWPDVAAVTLLDVLEHQADERHFLEALHRRMPSGARLIVTVPALQSLWSEWDVKLGHVRRYDKDELCHALKAFDFEMQEVSYLFPEMLAPAVVRRLRGGAANGAEFPILPKPINEALTALGRISLRARRFAPLGTSLIAVADKR